MPDPARAAVAEVRRPRGETEAALLANVKDAAEALGWRCHHETYSLGTRPGYPDITAVNARQRRAIWCELKGHKGRASEAQIAWLTDLRAADQEVYLWTWADWHSGHIERVLSGRERAAGTGEGTE